MSVSTTLREEIPAVPPPTFTRRISPRRCSRNKNKSVMENPDFLVEPPSSRKRRSSRGSSSLWELARFIKDGKRVVFITGAGLSVASGVRAFRTTNSSNSKNYSSDSAWKNNPASRGNGKKQKSEAKKTLVEEQPLAIWSSTLWTNAKRETFRKDPVAWWNDFFLCQFPVSDYDNRYNPNAGHVTLAALQRSFPDTIKIITQNVDGLQEKALLAEERSEEKAAKLRENIIEAHGRLGLYKCLPDDDSDTDSSSDEDDDRPVHLGHRRKHRAWKRRHESFAIARKKTPKPEPMDCAVSTDVSSGSSMSDTATVSAPTCEYQMLKSLRVDQLGPPDVRAALKPRRANPRAAAECDSIMLKEPRRLKTPPRCPTCGNKVLPQALLFDEGYHSHDHYNFIKMEDWLAAAEVLVFVGTSFSVTLPQVALDHARKAGLPVFNFNVSDMLAANARLNAENIPGPSQETLPRLYQAIQHLEQGEAMIY